MKNIKKFLFCFILILIGMFVIKEPVNAAVCDAQECATCRYYSSELTSKFEVSYDLKKYEDGSVTGEFNIMRAANVTVQNKITDYTFFVDKSTGKLTCPKIYTAANMNVGNVFCKGLGPLGMLAGCYFSNSWTYTIYPNQGIDLGLEIIWYELSRDTVSSSGGVSTSPETILYSCKYTGSTSKKSLTISKSEGGWVIEYPDGVREIVLNDDVRVDTFPTANCEDAFYSDSYKSVRTLDANSKYLDVYVAQYCGTYSDLEQFCSYGACKIRDVSCKSVENTTAQYGLCPEELRPVIFFLKKIAFTTLQIFIPIVLILMGTIDLVKAVAASDDKANKEAISKFIRRALSAVICFFIVTIVTIVMDMFARTDVGEQSDWKACWYNVD